MINKKRVFGLVLIIVSIVSSFSNLTLTGNVIGVSYSNYFSLFSVLSFILGVALMLAVLRYHNSRYEDIANRVYQKLIRRAADGHHTEQISELEKRLGRRDTSQSEVSEVIKREVEEGRLNEVHEGAISIPHNRDKITEIIRLYGNNMPPELIKKLEELRDTGKFSGSRAGSMY